MNIITADFNWISLLIIVVATVIGMVKSNTKKEARKPVFQHPDLTEEEDMKMGEWYTKIEKEEIADNKPTQKNMPGDYYKTMPKEEKKEQSSVFQTEPEEEEVVEKHTSFDIRQAVIASEILRRPEY